MSNVKLTSFLTGLPVSVDLSEIQTWRGVDGGTALYFKDDSMAVVSEDFEAVDDMIEALNKEEKK